MGLRRFHATFECEDRTNDPVSDPPTYDTTFTIVNKVIVAHKGSSMVQLHRPVREQPKPPMRISAASDQLKRAYLATSKINQYLASRNRNLESAVHATSGNNNNVL